MFCAPTSVWVASAIKLHSQAVTVKQAAALSRFVPEARCRRADGNGVSRETDGRVAVRHAEGS